MVSVWYGLTSLPVCCTRERGFFPPAAACFRTCACSAESARHWGMALGSFSCRPMVWGWGWEIIASLRSGWPWSILHPPVPATKLSITRTSWLAPSEEKQRLLTPCVHSCRTPPLNWLKHNLLAQAHTEEHQPCFFFLHLVSHYPALILTLLCFLISLHTCCLWHPRFPRERSLSEGLKLGVGGGERKAIESVLQQTSLWL